MNMTSPQHSSGFTLIEIIVSLMIFSIVAVVALGALLKIVDTNIKAQSLQDSVSNLDFALDSISRELRTGSKFDCQASFSGTFAPGSLAPTACTGGHFLAFQASQTDQSGSSCSGTRLIYAYYFAGPDPVTGTTTIEKAQQSTCTDILGSPSAPFVPVITSNVAVTNFSLDVFNPGGGPFPLGFLYLSGYAGANQREKERSYFDLQMAISPRIP